jgi:hypothetical protein
MKKILLIAAIVLTGTTLFGQWDDDDHEIKTIFGNNNFYMGGYGSFGGGYTVIDDKDAIVMSARGAWLVGRWLGFGVAGAGFINDFHYDAVLDADVNLTGGYGGVLIEPIIFPRSPVHLTFPVIAGVGGIAYTSSEWVRNDWDYTESWVEDTDTYLVFEPGVEIEFNLLKFLRLSGGVSYRYTSPIDLMDTPSDALEGITTSVSLKFGKF